LQSVRAGSEKSQIDDARLAMSGGLVTEPPYRLFERDAHGRPVILRDPASIYSFGLLIRKTEELLLRLFSQGLLSGTTHTCLGQEVCAMSVVRALTGETDAVLSNHRNHGHFLTYSGDFLGLVAEIMGREAGVCGGIGGSQHIAFRHFHSNGVQGGMTGIGVGHALAIQRRKEDGVVAIIIGDGTLGQGLLYESMNLASVWGVPALFVVENNGIAQTTPTVEVLGGSIPKRGEAFGLHVRRLDDADPDFLMEAESMVEYVRAERRPGLLVIETRRLGPHSKGDDLRDAEEIAAIRERDPLAGFGRLLDEATRARIEGEAEEFIARVHADAVASPESLPSKERRHWFQMERPADRGVDSHSAGQANFRTALNAAMTDLLENDPRVLLLGEDLHDPYGGAFKVTAGLSTRFSGRVISTPISEAGIMGAAIGLALAGFRPVVEVMFADFLTLGIDQIFNHAVKFPGMFANVRVPLVIRAAGGGRRGYGPTHSQSLENLMGAVPGLTVVFPSHRHDPGMLLRRALDWESPVVFFEHKLLYGRVWDGSDYRELEADPEDAGAAWFPTLVRGGSDPDITLVACGHSVLLAEAAAAQLAEEEVECEIVAPALLSPLASRTLTKLLGSRRRIVVVEEAPAEFGFSAELAAVLLEAGYRGAYRRVAPPALPIPAARSLEAATLPSERDVYEAAVAAIVADLCSTSRSFDAGSRTHTQAQ
jgi:2-oxoisovalerate dehydrogenase E1 component